MKKNRPVYRAERAKCGQICTCLTLMEMERSGQRLEGKKRLLVQLMEEKLTGKQLDYLRCYYVQAMNHRQIAQMMQCSPSAVSKGVKRAEERLEQALEQGRMLWGEDILSS